MDDPQLEFGRDETEYEAAGFREKPDGASDPAGEAGWFLQREREKLFEAFRQGDFAENVDRPMLILSKVGNFALDLPDAELMVQVSGTFGSRQEEAQRLGRLLRPKTDGRQSHFYSLVTRDTSEQEFAHKRQLFLAEQGYSYRILDASELE